MFVSSTAYNAKGQTKHPALRKAAQRVRRSNHATGMTCRNKFRRFSPYGNGVTSTYSYNDARGFLTRVLSVSGAVTLLDQNYTRNAARLALGPFAPLLNTSTPASRVEVA